MPDSPYRMTPPLPPDPYARAWRDLARWRAIGSAFPAAYAIAAVALLVGHAVWPLVIAAGLSIGADLHVRAFVCPHCESRFFRSGAKRWAKRCDKCGIQEDAPEPKGSVQGQSDPAGQRLELPLSRVDPPPEAALIPVARGDEQGSVRDDGHGAAVDLALEGRQPTGHR